jgi:signal transduction histidine kinase
MRVNKSLNDPWSHSGNQAERFANTTDFFCNAIENAGGVPFQLIFGPQSGEGHYLNIGSGITSLLGVAPEDFTEKKFHEMIEKVVPLSPDVPADPAAIRSKFLSGELKSSRSEVLVNVPGREKRWISDASVPLVNDATGRVIGLFGILFDISDYKSSQNIIRQAEKRAEELDRLKKAFLSNIAHEIRTPLNAIVGFSALLSDPEYGDKKHEEFREIITKNTDRLLAMITDIVELSKIEARLVSIRKVRVNINNIIRKIHDFFVNDATEKGISLTFRTAIDDDSSYILTDGQRLAEVLINLVGNAVKFTKEGKVELGYELKEGVAEFFVSDTGIGILPEHQADIFSRFYQADSSSTREHEGSGLGLTLAKAYVELLGGKIWFTSKPGEGTEFRFTVEAERSWE